MKALLRAIPLVLIVLIATSSFGQDADSLDQVVQPYVQNKTFMGSVLVAHGADVILSKGYGAANLEWNVPNAPSTKFRLGSITKQFTAASILLLEERGRLKLEDPIKKYLPDAPATWDRITIFNLLTHSSGIPNFTALSEYKTLELTDTRPAKIIAMVRDKPLDFPAGEKMSYSNSGYVSGYLIEKITLETYDKFVQEDQRSAVHVGIQRPCLSYLQPWSCKASSRCIWMASKNIRSKERRCRWTEKLRNR